MQAGRVGFAVVFLRDKNYAFYKYPVEGEYREIFIGRVSRFTFRRLSFTRYYLAYCIVERCRERIKEK